MARSIKRHRETQNGFYSKIDLLKRGCIVPGQILKFVFLHVGALGHIYVPNAENQEKYKFE